MNRPWKELLAPIFSLDDEGTDGETIGMGASPAAHPSSKIPADPWWLSHRVDGHDYHTSQLSFC